MELKNILPLTIIATTMAFNANAQTAGNDNDSVIKLTYYAHNLEGNEGIDKHNEVGTQVLSEDGKTFSIVKEITEARPNEYIALRTVFKYNENGTVSILPTKTLYKIDGDEHMDVPTEIRGTIRLKISSEDQNEALQQLNIK